MFSSYLFRQDDTENTQHNNISPAAEINRDWDAPNPFVQVEEANDHTSFEETLNFPLSVANEIHEAISDNKDVRKENISLPLADMPDFEETHPNNVPIETEYKKNDIFQDEAIIAVSSSRYNRMPPQYETHRDNELETYEQEASIEPIPSNNEDKVFVSANDYIEFCMNASKEDIEALNKQKLPSSEDDEDASIIEDTPIDDKEEMNENEQITNENTPDHDSMAIEEEENHDDEDEKMEMIERDPNEREPRRHEREKKSKDKANKLIKQIHDFGVTPNNESIKASEYLRQLRKQHDDSDASDSSDTESHPEVEDPFMTLLQIQPKEKDQPTTIEYDDRVFDKVIFQDEEFKEYRKNNIAITDHNYKDHNDKIVHRKKYNDEEEEYPNDDDENGYNENEYDEYYNDRSQKGNFMQKPVGKMRPNFFIALKISDARMKRKLKNAQKILMKELKDEIYERAMIDESMFHITINAIYCADDEEVFHLMNVFEKFGNGMFQRLMPTKLSVRLHVNGIGHFRQKVIWGYVDDDANKRKLKNVFHAMHTQLQNAGIINQQHYFEPHLTIMKLSKLRDKNKGLRIPMKVIDKLNAYYAKSMDFGNQYCTQLELLSMTDERQDEDADGYYQCISSIAPAKLR